MYCFGGVAEIGSVTAAVFDLDYGELAVGAVGEL